MTKVPIEQAREELNAIIADHRGAVVCVTHDARMELLPYRLGVERFICLACEREEADALEATFARQRADAWARSAKGTPYGATTPTVEVIDASKVPDALDPRVMARLLNTTEAKR
jgi:hypothetical protein